MGLVLRIEQRRLPPPVTAIFDAVESGTATVYVPAMVFAEILYLAEKHRISLSLPAVAEHLEQFQHYREYPMSFAVIQAAAHISPFAVQKVQELNSWSGPEFRVDCPLRP